MSKRKTTKKAISGLITPKKKKKTPRKTDYRTLRKSLFGEDTGIGSNQPVSKLRKKKIQGRSDITTIKPLLDGFDKYKKEAAASSTNTPAKNKRLRAVMEAKQLRKNLVQNLFNLLCLQKQVKNQVDITFQPT